MLGCTLLAAACTTPPSGCRGPEQTAWTWTCPPAATNFVQCGHVHCQGGLPYCREHAMARRQEGGTLTFVVSLASPSPSHN
eukprot:2816229-Rhodomonas_salina.2